jgi:secreted trypsin-like serine protease
MKRSSATILLTLGLVVASGCGGGGGGGGGNACSSLNAKVFGGDTCDQGARTPVLALFPLASDGGQLVTAGICTASLVTVDDFVTSAHCFTEPINELGNRIVGFGVVAGGDEGERILVSSYAVHPFYDGVAGSPFDVAMGTLSRVPSPAIGPLPVLSSVGTVVGESITTFGYGTSNEGEIGVLKAAELTIDAIEGGNIFASSESAGASVCQGDSGGPIVQERNGATSIVGVNSFVDVNSDECASVGANISGFVDIQSAAVLPFVLGYVPDVAQN